MEAREDKEDIDSFLAARIRLRMEEEEPAKEEDIDWSRGKL